VNLSQIQSQLTALVNRRDFTANTALQQTFINQGIMRIQRELRCPAPVVSGDNYLNNSRTVRKHSLGGRLGAVRSAPAWRTPSYHCYRMATPSSQRLHAGSALVILPRRLAAENLNSSDVEASSSRELPSGNSTAETAIMKITAAQRARSREALIETIWRGFGAPR
jgi:hypothetical protein